MENLNSSYCRLCAELTPSSKVFDLMSDSERCREVVEKLSKLKHGFVNMFRDNNLPKTVCYLCLDALYRAVAFVEKVESSQNTLKAILFVKNIKEEDHSTYDNSSDSNSDSYELDVKKEKSNEDDTECRITCSHDTSEKRKYKKKIKNEGNEEVRMTWKDYMWMCAFCQSLFSCYEELKSHSMETHDSCTAYKCTDCQIRKLKLDPFLIHVMRHRKHLRKYCYQCNARLITKKEADKHRRQHIRHKNVCDGCNMSFKNIRELVEHKSKYYTDKRATRVIRPLSEEDLVCNVCEKKFKTRAILQSHQLIHTNRRRDHTCDICGKCFFNKDTLMSHLVVHDDSRPYQCEICKFAFKTIGQLRMHIGTHDGDRPFACEQCGKRFRLRKNLTSHMVIHSDTLPHVCEYCNKGFRFKTILNQHIRQHTGVKPYSCSLCQRAFTNWSNYNKHMKRRHGMEMAKKKHTPDGVFPINPVTGEVVITPLTGDTEEWKRSVLQRKLIRNKPEQPNTSLQTTVPNLNVSTTPAANDLENFSSEQEGINMLSN